MKGRSLLKGGYDDQYSGSQAWERFLYDNYINSYPVLPNWNMALPAFKVPVCYQINLYPVFMDRVSVKYTSPYLSKRNGRKEGYIDSPSRDGTERVFDLLEQVRKRISARISNRFCCLASERESDLASKAREEISLDALALP